MSSRSTKPVIFISYSHKDEPKDPGGNDIRWLTLVQSHLAPAMKHGIYELWVDEDIPGGGEWRKEIVEKLHGCDVCILLVSRHSLASDFIIDIEIDIMLKRKKTDAVDIFPIVLTPCAIGAVPWLREINLRPPNGQPLSDFSENDRHKQLAAIAEEVTGIANAIAAKRAERTAPEPETVRRATDPDRMIDIVGLPETPYQRLVGRERELERLDRAWAETETNVLSFVAEGGAGKSALVNEWLRRFQGDNFRGAEVILGWSFYSQGSREGATAADEFLNWALDKLDIKLDTTSVSAKGEAIAAAMSGRRVLLVLDGVEPLQHGPGPQMGQLRDLGLRALLRRFALTPPVAGHGLIVLTSRLPIKDIVHWNNGAAPVVNVEELSEDAGAALLRDNGDWGTDAELRATSRDFGGHPLALILLASFLKETQFGDMRRRQLIRRFFPDPENPRHDHARRVMESYEREWLADEPVLLATMHMVGLFDRPASSDCLEALRSKPVIEGLTDNLVQLAKSEWEGAVARLREVGLLAPEDPSAPDALDAHPLVREWFGERLRRTNEGAWRKAHGRLYEHLRDTTEGRLNPSLEQLAPLYQAISHGCRAGRHEETLRTILVTRIWRGPVEMYPIKKLGAFGSDLAAISWFFVKPFEQPVPELNEGLRASLLGHAAYCLQSQGRLAEAMPARRGAVKVIEVTADAENAAKAVSALSDLELLAGDVPAAMQTAQRAYDHAVRSKNLFQMLARKAILANATHAAGDTTAAKVFFDEAEQLQRQDNPQIAILTSLAGYYFCDLLLAQGMWDEAYLRAVQSHEVAEANDWLLDVAVDTLTIMRASLGTALDPAKGALRPKLGPGFDRAVDELRGAGANHHLPRGLLARAAFHRSVGDWSAAGRDLDEVAEIGEPGPMRLFLCDMALEGARLAFARIEAFAPLNGMIKDSPPKPSVPDATKAARLKEQARTNLAEARKLITECGYDRRDEELAELEAVLAGTRRFADLPPRV